MTKSATASILRMYDDHKPRMAVFYAVHDETGKVKRAKPVPAKTTKLDGLEWSDIENVHPDAKHYDGVEATMFD